MPEISAVIITFNEEKNIARCLESLSEVVDEIVVVDSYSTDRTFEICSGFGVKFIRNKFEGYVQQKNFAVSVAKFPVVLSLDADEALSPDLQKAILAARKDWKYDGYYCKRLNNYCGKWIRYTSWYPDRKLRLWDKSKGNWGGLNPHDKVELTKGSRTGRLPGYIEHYSYYSIREHVAQVNAFSGIAAKSYYNNGIESGFLHIMFIPLWKLIRELFVKRGILGGYYCIVISIILSFETFLKYLKLNEMYRNDRTRNGGVVFFNSSKTWGGGEQWHYQTALKLRELGYDSQIIVNRNSELYWRLRNKGIRVKRFRIYNWSIFNPFKIFMIRRFFKRNRTDTVVLNLSRDGKIGGFAAFMAGVPRIVYRRGLANPVSNTLMNRFLFRKIFTHVIANSEDTKRKLFHYNTNLFPKDKIRVLPNWIESGEEQKRPEEFYYTRKHNELVLGNLGRMVEQKSQKSLIEVAARLKALGTDFRMLIGGTGKLENELKDNARRLEVENEVIFTGFVRNVGAFMESIDVFLLSSYYEGFGFVIAEAMNYKRPVIAFNLSSNPEIIIDGMNGFLVPPGDLESFTRKIILLDGNRRLISQMGEKGKDFVSEKFGFEKQLPELIQLLGLKK